jgi:hypothetical protein
MNSQSDINLLIRYFESLARSQDLMLRCSPSFNVDALTRKTLRIQALQVFLVIAPQIKAAIDNPRIFQVVRQSFFDRATDDYGNLRRSIGGVIEFIDGIDILCRRISADIIFEYAIFYFLGSNPTDLTLLQIRDLFIEGKHAMQKARPDQAAAFEPYVEEGMKRYIDVERLYYDRRPQEDLDMYMKSLIPLDSIH